MANQEKMTCPYNVAHEIIPERFQSHLYKCRENYPLTEYKPCKWNACHDVPVPEYQYHLTVCVDRKKVDTAKFQVGEYHETAAEIIDIPLPPSSNEWDDVDQPSYLEVKENVLEKKEVLRIPVGTTKSKKRDFYQHEHEKFDNLSKGEEPEPSRSMNRGMSSKKTTHAPPPGYRLGMGRGTVFNPPVRPNPGRSEVPSSSSASASSRPQPGAQAFSPESDSRIKRERLSDDENPRNEDDEDDDDDGFQIVIHHKGLGRGRRRH